MALSQELERIAHAAASHAEPGEELAGILAAEPAPGARVYLCAFAGGDGDRSWLALDADARPLSSRARVRQAVSIAAMCELAGEAAGGGKLEELRADLVALRLTEAPSGIEEAEEAALALEATVGAPPVLASPERLDAIGAATRRLERALGDDVSSPFAEAMKQALPAVDALAEEVVRANKLLLA